MKKMLCLALLFAIIAGLFSGCSDRIPPLGNTNSFDKGKIDTDTINSNSQFAFNIFKELVAEDTDQNTFISPLSISTALAMTYQGAGTTTKEAMANALQYINIDDEKLNENYKNLIPYLKQIDKKIELNISNSIWIKEGKEIKEDFISTNKNIFDASVSFLDFSKKDAADKINQWISNATKKKIDKMIEPPIPSNIIMYLINAIYFKGDWTNKFDKKNTFDSQFYAGDGTTNQVMMMRRKGKIEYGQGDNFKTVRLPYGNGKVAMYCILPDKDVPINTFINSFDLDRWNIIKESISETDDVELQLPRFKLEYGIKNLNDSLIELGMGEAFTDRADFSKISEGVYISDVLHKAVIEVNEEGSEAAAVTIVAIKEAAAVEPITFIADRPFVFVIADDETGTILFMGRLFKI
jgi:serine protease inhibitor